MRVDREQKAKVGDALDRLQGDEGGAVMMLGLAGALILFMVGLVMYDAGFMARENIDNQMAADTAAYSQASVKARAMNNIAFANVAKRTTVGIRNMWWGNYIIYLGWWASECSKACCWPFCFNCRELFNCIGNIPTVVADLMDFINHTFGSTDMDDYLETLDGYQQSMVEYSGYWGFGEGILRGLRNGAHSVTTYPQPDNDDWGGLPVERSGNEREACLFWFESPMTAMTVAEWYGNYEVLKDNSDAPAPDGPQDVVNPAGSLLGCILTGVLLGPSEQAPMYLTERGDDGSGMLARSNFIFTFRANEAVDGQLRDNYEFVDQDYEHNLMDMQVPSSGMWSMARGEVYFPDSAEPWTLFDGAHGIDLYHPGWMGKLRPVTLPGENIPVDTTDMWGDARTTAYAISMISGGPSMEVNDLLYMQMVMMGLNGEVNGEEVTNGLPK